MSAKAPSRAGAPARRRAAPAPAHAPSSLEHYRPRWTQAVASVRRHVDYGAGHRWLDLDLPKGFAAPVAGQFVQLLLPAPAPVLLPRPMSVAAVGTRGGKLTIGFLYAPVGAGTRVLARLPVGASVEVLGPLGRGYPLEDPGTPVLVAGGRGVAPLLLAADTLASRGRRSAFVFGARTSALLVGLADARAKMRRLGGTLHLATDDGSRGTRGTVLDVLAGLERRLAAPLAIHACGPHAMLKAVALWALARGHRAHLAMESVMACGTGVCRGCPMPRSEASRLRYRREQATRPSLYGNAEYAMCCTEGPVFEAADLDWDGVE